MTVADLKLAREKLSANNLESGLPGREIHSEQIFNFIFERLKVRRTTEAKKAKIAAGEVANIKGRHNNKTMFVCGVPGTGKTATIMCVVDKMKKLIAQKPSPIQPFKAIYINSQSLSAPEKIYTEILSRLTGETCNPERSQEKLNALFYSDPNETMPAKRKRKAPDLYDSYKIIVIDELDLLYNEKKQTIFYNLFDWPTSVDSKVILIAIANAMDLPERFMRGRTSSRLGWDKLVFESYTSDCLEAILKARLGKTLMDKCFSKAAIVVATKRIGRTTGDARRILDTCRSALDKTIQSELPIVTPDVIDKVGFQNLDTHRSDYVRECQPLLLMVLKSILTETKGVGEENVTATGVYKQLVGIMKRHEFFQTHVVGHDDLLKMLYTLAGIGLIYLESDKPLVKRRIFLSDDSEAFKDLIRTQPINLA